MKKLILTLALAAGIVCAASGPLHAQTAEEEIKGWAEKAAAEAMTFDHANFEERKAANKQYFTPKGFASFYEALDISLSMNPIGKPGNTMTAKVKCAAEVQPLEEAGGISAWAVTVPLEVTYTTRIGSDTQVNKTMLRVEKDPSNQTYGIAQWISMPYLATDAPPCAPETEAAPAPTDE